MATQPIPPWRRALPWAGAGIAIAVALAISPSPGSVDLEQPANTDRLQIDIGSRDLTTGDLPFSLSPDGRALAYVDQVGATTQILVRHLDESDGRPVPGTEGGHAPFFSPDGQSLGFFARNQVMKVPLLGGEPQALGSLPHTPGGADWSRDGSIVYSSVYAPGMGLMRVSEAGGEVEELTVPDTEEGEIYHHWPQFLPGGEHLLFSVHRRNRKEAAILTLETGEWRILPGILGRARYADSGHLIYGESEALLAAPFDLDRLEVIGNPVTLLDGLPTLFGGAGTSFQEAAGVLAYFGAKRPYQALVWADRAGELTPLPIDEGSFHWIQMAPDGERLLYSDHRGFFTVVHDIEGGSRVRLENGIYGVWGSDGYSIVYSKRLSGVAQIHRRSADGSGGNPEPLLASGLNHVVTSLSPDGRYVAFYEQNPETGRDIWVLDLEGDGEAEPLLVGPANERSAVFSPDGHWLAFTSDRTGRDEVYLRRFEPRSQDDLLVSTDGGREPVWHPDGAELFYRAGQAVLAVPLELEQKPLVGKPEVLFEGRWAVDPGGLNQMYDVTPDGERFVMIQNSDDLGLVNLVVNWTPGAL